VVGSFLGILGINHDNIRSLRRHQNEIWMRDLVSFAAYSSNLVGHERHSVIEFANRFDYHDTRIILAYRVFKIYATRASSPCDANSVVTSSKPAVFVI